MVEEADETERCWSEPRQVTCWRWSNRYARALKRLKEIIAQIPGFGGSPSNL
jgi:hypothetical protein